MTAVEFRKLDYSDDQDARTLVGLLDAYARDPMGGGEPLSQFAVDNLAKSMAATPGAFTVAGRQRHWQCASCRG